MRLGSCEILHVVDGVFEASSDVLVHLDGKAATRRLRETWPDPAFRVEVACFALSSADEVILVDAGTGPSWGVSLGHTPSVLRAAGITPDRVDKVLLTHLHGDHALGLFDGETALFARADILVSRAELAYFTNPHTRAAASEDAQEVFRIAERLIAIYGKRVRPIDPGPVHPLIEAVLLAGHTEAHCGYLLRHGNSGLLFCGDMIQVVQPILDFGAGLIYDHDPAQAARTRRDWLDGLARTGWLLAGGHVPGFTRVEALANSRFHLHRIGKDDV